jgi:transcriptional regulator MraZ
VFLGQFEYRIDEKGRMPMPPRFRPYFKDGVIVAPSPDKCVTVYTIADWKQMVEGLTGLPASKMRKIERGLIANAFHTALDGQGRISLPSKLRTYANLATDIVVAGTNNRIELWDKAAWEAEESADLAEAFQIIESIEKH